MTTTPRSRIPQIDTCCCLCSLETGTKIIGFTELILFGLGALLGIGTTIYYNITHAHSGVGIGLFLEVSFLYQALFAAYLLVGVYKKRYPYIKVWIMVQAAFIVQSLVAIVVLLITIIFGSEHYEIIDEIIIVVIQTYLVLVVYSYYREVTGGNLINEIDSEVV